MHTDRTHADWACACGLAGGRDVLDALAARLAPAGVLAEAERLLRAAGVSEAQFTWTTGLLARDGDAYEPTLAEAYAKLKEGNHG
jgi:hypothetical protein